MPKPADTANAHSPPVAAPPAPKPLITLNDLSQRRDLWPSKVTLTQKVALSATESLAAGREVALFEMMGGDVAIDTGTDLVQIPSTHTDVLARASALIASLTPEQLALRAQDLSARSDLWPLEVELSRTLQFQNGKQVAAGTAVVLRKFVGASLEVYDRTLKDHFQCEIHETDVIRRARERMTLPEAERKPFFVRSLAAAVEPAAGSSLESSELVLVFQGRAACPRCDAFAPRLQAFYERAKPQHPRFEAVYLGLDADPAATRAHAAKKQYPGRVLTFDKRMEAGDLGSLGGELLPLVFLLDAEGKVLARNDPKGGSPSAEDVLAAAEAKLSQAR